MYFLLCTKTTKKSTGALLTLLQPILHDIRRFRTLTRLLSLPFKSAATSEMQAMAQRVSGSFNVMAYCNSNIKDSSLAPIVANYVSALSALLRQDYKDAFVKQMVIP